jgi:glyoxylase-like metal-dependent hydrolase (beta-lactamase superfamily II)
VQIATAQSWYETRTLRAGITHIFEPHIKPFYRCNIWHVRGRDQDLLIDSGMGVVSLREQVAIVAERSLLAVASHTHFDHIGGHHEFPARAVHRAEAGLLRHPDRPATLSDPYVSDAIFTALPPGDYDSSRYEVTPAPATRVLEDGDLIDLGDRHFEIIHVPGHSPGSIALWENASGILFSGDAVYDGPLIDDAYHSDINAYIASMERLLTLPVEIVHGGHYPSFGGERYHELIRRYLEDKS